MEREIRKEKKKRRIKSNSENTLGGPVDVSTMFREVAQMQTLE